MRIFFAFRTIIVSRACTLATALVTCSVVVGTSAAPAPHSGSVQTTADIDLVAGLTTDAGAERDNVEATLAPAGKDGGAVLRLRAKQEHSSITSPGFDAAQMHGKIVELRFRMRSAPGTGTIHGAAWLRADVPGATMRSVGTRRLLAGPEWSDFSARLVVDAAVTRLRVGFEFQQPGELQLTGLQLRSVGDSPMITEDTSSAPLSSVALAQLNGFGHALALVRYFSPSAAVETADWNALARAGARAFATPLSSAEYATKIQTILGPYAPRAQWLQQGETAQAPAPRSATADLVRRVHRGYGTRHAFYRSWWETVQSNKADPSWDVPDINEMLAGGVRLVLPVVDVVEHGDAPSHRPESAVMLTEQGELPSDRMAPEYSGDDRYTRLADALQLWGALRYFYPYGEVVAVPWNTALDQALQSAAQDADRFAFDKTLNQMMTELRDGHAWVRGPYAQDEFVPAVRIAIINGHSYVAPRVAQQGGICAASPLPLGSEVVAVDGEPVATRRLAIAHARRTASENAQLPVDEAYLLAGQANSPALIRYRDARGRTTTTLLRRDTKMFELGCGPQAPAVYLLAPGIVYVDMSKATGPALQTAMPQLMSANTIIFDARVYSVAGVTFLGHFAARDLLVPHMDIPLIYGPRPEDRQWDRLQQHVAPLTPAIHANVFYLAGAASMSAAETYLQTVKYYGLGTIVGQRTAGTNGDIASIALPGGYTAYWTGLRVLKQDGQTFHGVGIEPDVTVTPTLRELLGGRDTVLEAALALAKRQPPKK